MYRTYFTETNLSTRKPQNIDQQLKLSIPLMDCRTCQTHKSRFICSSCLSELIVRHDNFLKKSNEQLSQFSANSLKNALQLDDTRDMRAQKAQLSREIAMMKESLDKERDAVINDRSRLLTLRERLSKRKNNLRTATSMLHGLDDDVPRRKEDIVASDPITRTPKPSSSSSSSTSTLRKQITEFRRESDQLYRNLARTRTKLLKQTLDIFAIQKNSSRNAYYSNVDANPEYSITSLVLPVPGDIRRYPPATLDAAVSHLAHCIRLIAIYLGIKMPFTIFTGPKPSIRATGDSPWGSKWSSKQSLSLITGSSIDPSQTTTANNDINSSRSISSVRSFSSFTSLAMGQTPHSDPALSDEISPSKTNQGLPANLQTFTIGFLMLAYDVSYLLHTQYTHHPACSLSKIPNVLANLRALVDDAHTSATTPWADNAQTLGRRSHVTMSRLPTLEEIMGTREHEEKNGAVLNSNNYDDDEYQGEADADQNSLEKTVVPQETRTPRRRVPNRHSDGEVYSENLPRDQRANGNNGNNTHLHGAVGDARDGSLLRLDWPEVDFEMVLATAAGKTGGNKPGKLRNHPNADFDYDNGRIAREEDWDWVEKNQI